MKDQLRFIAHFVKSPLTVGAVAPSSRWLARRMVQGMHTECAKTVVELGPGTGVFTREILNIVSPEALLLAVEINPSFARQLARKFPRITVIQDSAERLERHLKLNGRDCADEVVSGLPWASFPSEQQERIMDSVLESLKPGGQFTTFAYLHAAWFPTARRFSRLLESRFSLVKRTPVVWRNLPPAFVYRCTK